MLHNGTYGRCVASLSDRRRRSFVPWARRICIGLLVAVAVAVMSRGGPCVAQDWTVTPSVSLYGSFTSNANLNPEGQGDPDFFTTLVPAVDIRGDTSRLKLNFDYSLAAIAYASNPNLDQLRNNLNFVSTLTVIPEFLFVDGLASIQQVPSNGQLPTSSSPLAASTNLQTVSTYNISPYVKNHLGSFADSEFRYTFNQVLTGSTSAVSPTQTGQLSNSLTNSLTETLVSGSQFTHLLWTILADVDSTNFTGGNPDTSGQLYQASAEYRLDRQVGLLASVGYERISGPTFSPEPEPTGPIGSVGIKYTPGPRTSIVLNLNHRYNRNFATGTATYLLGTQSRIRANYTDQDYTSSQALFSNNLSFLTTDEFGNFIDSRTQQIFSLASTNFGLQPDAFRQRSFNLDLHLVHGRDVFDAGGYWQDRNVFHSRQHSKVVSLISIAWMKLRWRVWELGTHWALNQRRFGSPRRRTGGLAPLTTFTPRSHAVPWPTGALGRPPQPRKCGDEAGGYCGYTAEVVLSGPQSYPWGSVCAREK